VIRERGQDLLNPLFGRQRVRREELEDVVVFAAPEQDAVGIRNRSTRPADLLIVMDDGLRALEMDDEAEIRLIETHPEGRRGDERLDLAALQASLAVGFRAIYLRVSGRVPARVSSRVPRESQAV